MKRKIITIDHDKCTGCGQCMPNCPEGAIQMIDGKARLISDLFCDGLGACIGHCPEAAISIEEREAVPYDEKKVMENIIKQGPNTIKAHLEHLMSHDQCEFLGTALEVLKQKGIPNPLEKEVEMKEHHGHEHGHEGCPSAKSMNFGSKSIEGDEAGKRPSQLSHWPLQMHLISPDAPQYRGSDLLISADCVAYSLGDFHKDWLKGKTLAIACPKLDEGTDVYEEKITALIDDAKINTLTVMTMQVPCCSGLLQIAKTAAGKAKRKVPIKHVVVGLQGNILSESWV